ncbi:hypothetical protein RFI_11078 [Reticulomyxa filosa]|uniref:Uncharacterized protein n=1 Tax=Reticulomyxa filosa TaxID=46433 RepID=X6NK09_RETFI|nr:hypothetical protein RFI_11078 [Reticulomyxa filosa]|eukprot:ETO26059.1 hypothetical protein RFI_11078 [Reticulomyxa filosa]
MAVTGKTLEEVKRYYECFWRNYTKMEGYEKLIERINLARSKSEELSNFKTLLQKKIPRQGAEVLNRTKLIYQLKEKPDIKMNGFTLQSDRFLLAKVLELGFDAWDIIKMHLLQHKAFRFGKKKKKKKCFFFLQIQIQTVIYSLGMFQLFYVCMITYTLHFGTYMLWVTLTTNYFAFANVLHERSVFEIANSNRTNAFKNENEDENENKNKTQVRKVDKSKNCKDKNKGENNSKSKSKSKNKNKDKNKRKKNKDKNDNSQTKNEKKKKCDIENKKFKNTKTVRNIEKKHKSKKKKICTFFFKKEKMDRFRKKTSLDGLCPGTVLMYKRDGQWRKSQIVEESTSRGFYNIKDFDNEDENEVWCANLLTIPFEIVENPSTVPDGNTSQKNSETTEMETTAPQPQSEVSETATDKDTTNAPPKNRRRNGRKRKRSVEPNQEALQPESKRVRT